MFKRIAEKLQALSWGWVALSTAMLMALFMIFVLPGQAGKSLAETGSARSPDTSFLYTPEELYQIAQQYGPEGRQAYIKTRWTFDLIFPIIYTSFLTAGIGWFTKQLPTWGSAWTYSNLLPVLGGLFDYLENGGATWLMAVYPNRIPGLAALTAGFSLAKWLLISLAFIAYLIVGVGALVTWIKKKPGG